MKTAQEYYTELRKEHRLLSYYTASRAFDAAKRIVIDNKTRIMFYNNDNVRMRIVADTYAELDNLLGDCFDPNVNSDVNPNTLKQQRIEEIDRINSDGVWGIVGEYMCPHCDTWIHADSVWGFVGEDYEGSGYDTDVMSVTLETYKDKVIQ